MKVKGKDRYLYRAVDSTVQTIDFLLTAKRDTAAAKRFLLQAIEASGNAMPRVINVDKNPAYPAAIEALTAEGTLPSREENKLPEGAEASAYENLAATVSSLPDLQQVTVTGPLKETGGGYQLQVRLFHF